MNMMNFHRRLPRFVILIALLGFLGACGLATTVPTTVTTEPIGWDGESIVYDATAISRFGSGTPSGTVHRDTTNDTAVIWNTDASLDNYGGIQTPMLSLDFSQAVIFRMEVVECYTQYIVKLAVEGESEYFYVLSDSGASGVISINVVDAMLSDKYRTKNTQPDPGYASGWKYDGEVKNCTFHILAKGPDGIKQTAELVIRSIAVYNNQTAVTGVSILSSAIQEGVLERLKGAAGVQLTATIQPAAVTDNAILWSSLDETIATVNASGFVTFTGVGTTTVTATAAIDQSKTATVLVNVTSGYEALNDLRNGLASIAYEGSTAEAAFFEDLYATTWSDDEEQTVSLSTRDALSSRISGGSVVIENYFDPFSSLDVLEAVASLEAGSAGVDMILTGSGGATVYRNINGHLYQERYDESIHIAYATYDTSWHKMATYQEHGIVVWDNGSVRRYDITVAAVTEIAAYTAADFADPTLWIVPDRTRQAEDPVIHALSPALVSLVGAAASIRQNKYAEAKYCFGGLVSGMLQSEADKTVEIILDVISLNQMNAYVKTMWEIKILYYQSATGPVISSNPLKIASGNTAGIQTITFVPAHPYFRLYLVVNGSDIGAQFADATMQIGSLKLHSLD